MEHEITEQANEILDQVQGVTPPPPSRAEQALNNLEQLARAFLENELALVRAEVERLK